MLMLNGMAHIRTGRHIKSFRACPTATGRAMPAAEAGRITREEFALANRQLRRAGLAEGWRRHLDRIGRAHAGLSPIKT